MTSLCWKLAKWDFNLKTSKSFLNPICYKGHLVIYYPCYYFFKQSVLYFGWPFPYMCSWLTWERSTAVDRTITSPIVLFPSIYSAEWSHLFFALSSIHQPVLMLKPDYKASSKANYQITCELCFNVVKKAWSLFLVLIMTRICAFVLCSYLFIY